MRSTSDPSGADGSSSDTLGETAQPSGSDRAPGPVEAPAPELPALDEQRFAIVNERARGGVGLVFEATDRLLGRRVALKQPQDREAASSARFMREALITARLQHPAVVPIYDVALRASGQPCYSMRLISGATLRDAIAGARGLDERLALLRHLQTVADAAAYAHEQGIVHRDLKPSNVLLGPFGETVVIDWGLAKDLRDQQFVAGIEALTRNAAGGDDITGTGAVLGTPGYMPPEQARGEEVDQRADVYAIGAMLYHLLTGQPPYAERSAGGVLGGPPPPVEQREPGTPADLVAILDKAMARDPALRYDNGRELAEDLRRFLDGQLVKARGYRPHVLAQRWLGRHRAVVAVAAVLLSLLAATAVTGVRRILTERNAAVDARRAALARENALVLLQAQSSLLDDPTAALAWLKRFRPSPEQAWLGRVVAEEAVARGAARHVFRFDAPSDAFATSPSEPVMAVGSGDGSLWLFDLETSQRRLLGRQQGRLVDLAFTPDGRLLASLDGLGRLRLQRTDGRLLHEVSLAPGAAGLKFSDDGQQLALGVGNDVLKFAVGDLARRVRIPLPTPLASLRFCGPDGVLVALDFAGRAAVLDPGASRPRLLAGRHPDARHICLPDGRRFISGGTDGVLRLWDLAAGPVRLLGRHPDWIAALAASSDGSFLASGSGDDTIQLHHLPSGTHKMLRGHEDIVRGLVFSRDGQTLASASRRSVELWDTGSGELLVHYEAPGAQQTGRIALSHDGRWVIAFGIREARVLPMAAPQRRVLRGHDDLVTDVTWAPGGRSLATASRDGTVRSWNLDTGGSWSSPPLGAWTKEVSFLDPRRLLAITRNAEIKLIDLATRRIVQVAAAGPWVKNQAPCCALAPAGGRLAYLHDIDVVRVRDITGGRDVRLEGSLPVLSGLVFSGDGTRVAASSWVGLAGLWDGITGRRLAFRQFPWRISRMALAPDRRQLALLTGNNGVLLWRTEPDRLTELPTDGLTGPVLSFTPDGRSLVYQTAGSTLRLLDLATGTVRVLRGHRGRITNVSFARTGGLMASADVDGFVRIWSGSGARSALLQAAGAEVNTMAFSPDGRRLAISGQEARVHIWDLDTVQLTPPVSDEGAWLEAHTSATIDGAQTPRTP